MDRFSIDGLPVFEALRNPVIDQMTRHSSVRHFDPDRPLPEGLVEMMMASAQSAPTSSNFQSWSVVVIRDPERKRRMRELCDNQAFIEQAPLFLAFCADSYRHKYVTARQGYRFGSDYLELLLVSVIDSALAAQNAALAAESLGLGCCMVGAIRNRAREVAEFLELPPSVFATIGLAVGYPASPSSVKPRLPQSVVVHQEKYSPAGMEQGIDAYDKRMAQTDIYKGRRVRIPGVTPEPEQDTGHYGWAEHTARRMARGNDFRRDLAPFLKEHGFVLE
ncbi:NADPH-dependent oxidoreductase [Paenibacillus cisolokensis]|jgi:Nitroreductase|uniref:NADPH-dependent oxidoreductase n=1 Tax=Paenibacillus cisolokensis TaxID=1658519 RepID=A0ABQ4NBI2_9BACL|nr:nitroreductase family protein [Paenibacillus cisolokensis]GIQ65236.1 NADPH-dependent oxidoreductase [Paenibacillus cisolokensis]